MPRFLIYTALILLSSCTFIRPHKSTPPSPGIISDVVETYYSSQQCYLAKTLRWVENQNELDKLVNGRLPDSPVSPPPIVLERINFTEHSILLISLGEKPSAGFGIGLLSQKISKEGNTGIIELLRRKPGEKEGKAQLTTSPCLILKLPGRGYSSFRLIDQFGEIIGEIDGRSPLSGADAAAGT